MAGHAAGAPTWMALVLVVVQGAGFDDCTLAASVCNVAGLAHLVLARVVAA